MSAGNCPRCGGDGVHPSKINPAWSVWCGLCQHTGNYPPTVNPIIAWWYRVTDRIDAALDGMGVL
jgi:hypothetical protein